MDSQQLLIAVVLVVCFIGALLFLQNNKNGSNSDVPKKKVKRFDIFTWAEVQKHNSRNDAWIAIKNKDVNDWRVYDVTDYVDEHPGGENILKNMGGDATDGFYGPHHPQTTFVMVEEFCIGKLAEGEAPY